MVQQTKCLMVQQIKSLMVQPTKRLMVQSTKNCMVWQRFFLMVRQTKSLMVQPTKSLTMQSTQSLTTNWNMELLVLLSLLCQLTVENKIMLFCCCFFVRFWMSVCCAQDLHLMVIFHTYIPILQSVGMVWLHTAHQYIVELTCTSLQQPKRSCDWSAPSAAARQWQSRKTCRSEARKKPMANVDAEKPAKMKPLLRLPLTARLIRLGLYTLSHTQLARQGLFLLGLTVTVLVNIHWC